VSFKDSIAYDLIHVFFNQSEFSEQCTWNNKKISCVIDDDSLIRKYSAEFDELPKGSHMVFLRESEVSEKLKRPPKVNDVVVFNGNTYTINEVKKESGLITVFLASGRL